MTDMYTRMVVPIDGSYHSKQALSEAIEVATRNNAHLFVILVREDSVFGAEDPMFLDSLEKEQETTAHILTQATNRLPDAIPSEVYSLHGNHNEVITQQAVDQKVDLIVMGATGKHSLERVLLGSTTTYVVNHAPCNVLVVR